MTRSKLFRSVRWFALFAILLQLSTGNGLAVDRITASVVLTNAPTTNGMTFVVTTTTVNTRTWTNAVQNSATQILTNSTAAGSATNLANHLAATPIPGMVAILTGETNVTLYGNSGVPIAVTGVGNYFSVTYSTQSVTAAWTVRVPQTVESAAQRTNVSSGLVDWLNYSGATNQLAQVSPAMSQLVGTTNTQTVTGNKTFTGTILVSNETGIFHIGTVIATNFTGTINLISNGVWWNGFLTSPTLTNAINYGNAFRSPGSGFASEQFGSAATASGAASTALGASAYATELDATAIGTDAGASAPQTVALGSQALANVSGGVAIGSVASALHTNAVALGVGTTTTEAYQIRLGSDTDHVSIPGRLRSFRADNTNNFPTHSDIAFGRFAVTSLANGNNAAVPVGTNVFIEVSGPSGAFTINGINAANAMRDGKLIVILNQTGQDMTIAHQSGTDPAAANRIITMTGADRATTGNGAATLIYSGAASRWILVSFDP